MPGRQEVCKIIPFRPRREPEPPFRLPARLSAVLLGILLIGQSLQTGCAMRSPAGTATPSEPAEERGMIVL